jgi:hypothetical protein
MLNDMCSFLLSNLTKCQIEHLVKITFDLIKSDKGYLYYLGTLWVSLVKMPFGLVKNGKGTILCKYPRGFRWSKWHLAWSK